MGQINKPAPGVIGLRLGLKIAVVEAGLDDAEPTLGGFPFVNRQPEK